MMFIHKINSWHQFYGLYLSKLCDQTVYNRTISNQCQQKKYYIHSTYDIHLQLLIMANDSLYPNYQNKWLIYHQPLMPKISATSKCRYNYTFPKTFTYMINNFAKVGLTMNKWDHYTLTDDSLQALSTTETL